MRSNLLFPILLFLAAMQSCSLPAQKVDGVTDYTGATQYRAPRGWTIQTSEEQGVFTWLAEETPGASGSPGLMVLAMPDPGGNLYATAEYFLQEIVTGLHITTRKDAGANQLHLQASGNIQGTAARLAITAMRDQRFLYLALFAAPEKRFDQLQGAGFLYQALQQPNPYQGEEAPAAPHDNRAPAENHLNMQDVSVQNALIDRSGAIAPTRLQGKWVQAVSALTGDDYLVEGNAIQLGERGYGHILELRANGSYLLTYLYKSYSNGCPYESQVVENGSYALSGNVITLQRGQYKAEYNVCGQRSTENKGNLPSLQFQLGMDSGGNHLVLRGRPFEYTISQDYDANGQLYFQEGFSRE